MYESGPAQFIGNRISMSSDGSIITFAGSVTYPARVHKLIENQEWIQFGHDISLSSARYYILPILSASGRTLALASISTPNQIYQVMTHIYINDEVSQLWMQSLVSLPLVNSSAHSADKDVYPYLAALVDLLTIGFQSGNSIKAYCLVQSTNSMRPCYNKELTFNFTIKPD